eukprot:COSAG05_NODE_1769_length_4114_cov_2.830137_3_plen_105_part_00
MKLELAAVEEVEKLLDDAFDDVSRDVSAQYEAVAGEASLITASGLSLLEKHIGFVKKALLALKQKIAFCSSVRCGRRPCAAAAYHGALPTPLASPFAVLAPACL